MLLLSGIGPPAELLAHKIKVQHPLAGVGKNLQDHCGFFVCEHMGHGFSDRISFLSNPEAVAAARKQWDVDHSGPLSHHFSTNVLGYIKNDKAGDTAGFKSLDAGTRDYLLLPNVPHVEFAWVCDSLLTSTNLK